jgi:ADP-heptose:LPS heptosyltransferase
MSTSGLRRFDRWVGVPAAGLLTLFRRRRDADAVLRADRGIVLVKLAEQGATVLAVPAIRRAVELVGRERVHAVVFSSNRPVFDELDLIPAGNIHTIDGSSPSTAVRDAFRVVRRLRAARVGAAVDFEFFARSSAVLCALSGATVRSGLHSYWGEGPWRGDLSTHRVSWNPQLHVADVFLQLVDVLTRPAGGLPACDPLPVSVDAEVPRPAIDEADRTRVHGLVAAVLGRDPDEPLGELVVVNPNSGDLLPLRRWPHDRYVELVRRVLAADGELTVLVTGGPDEVSSARALVDAVDSPRCASIAGRTTLHDLVVLYGLATVLVTNDSGPAHYAALSDVEVVTLFGPESPAVFGSRSPRSTAVWSGLPCSPCVNALNDRRTTCTDNRCMQAISVDEVAVVVAERRQRALRG